MPQNPSTNKISSSIGIVLLTAIIAFTIFINVFIEKPIEEIEEVKEVAFVEPNREKPYSEPFTATDYANFWKLENVYTSYIRVGSSGSTAQVEFYENTSKLGDSITLFYGQLDFTNSTSTYENEPLTFINFEGSNSNLNSILLTEIGNLFIQYQINSVINQPKYGDFTCIYFKNGSRVFLVKKNAKIIDKYYKKLIKEAEYINDSTKVASPEMVRQFNRENEF